MKPAWLGSLIVSLVVLVGCEEPVPENPGFEEHVRPIFQARCVRCHGAGGMVNADPVIPDFGRPGSSFLGEYDDETTECPREGEPPKDPSPTCHAGAASVKNLITFYVHKRDAMRMPPPPSPSLTDWEMAVVDAWAAETPPRR